MGCFHIDGVTCPNCERQVNTVDYRGVQQANLFQITPVPEPLLTKREYYAALALQGLLARDKQPEDTNYVQRANSAVRCADALIAALNAKEPGNG